MIALEQFLLSIVVRLSEFKSGHDDWNAGSTAQLAYGVPRTPLTAIVHAAPAFIWGTADQSPPI
jgi:hypothetical protein